MTNSRVAAVMLALGLAIGSGSTLALQPALRADAHSSMDMNTGSKSAGDAEMMQAMMRMHGKMETMKSTGDQDHDFMLMMIPHHQSAVDMAKIELKRGKHPELKSLARDIIKSQDAEITRMHGWLQTWYH